ncbi:MAG: hypothetical protein KGL39_14555 [Patescibacteria group bacterium]|nr:hypothetical protein [Patescibacteria group bacterium]
MTEKTLQEQLREYEEFGDAISSLIPNETCLAAADELDRLTAQLQEARELLARALTFVTNETDSLAECHENPDTGYIEPEEVAEEVAAARRWIEAARAIMEQKP